MFLNFADDFLQKVKDKPKHYSTNGYNYHKRFSKLLKIFAACVLSDLKHCCSFFKHYLINSSRLKISREKNEKPSARQKYFFLEKLSSKHI